VKSEAGEDGEDEKPPAARRRKVNAKKATTTTTTTAARRAAAAAAAAATTSSGIKPKKKRKRKPTSSRASGKKVLSVEDRYAEHRSNGTAFYATIFKCLAMCVGLTVADVHDSLNPAKNATASDDALLDRVAAEARGGSGVFDRTTRSSTM